jgi:UDP-glucose 4-epimerase
MILVTGGTGYIGSHIVNQLPLDEVVVVDNLSTSSSASLLRGEEFIQTDLTDLNQLEKVFNKYHPDTILHLAASIDTEESIRDPLKYYQNNTVNTFHLLKLCQKYQLKHFIFSSTAAVYGQSKTPLITETSPLSPLNPYGWSKLMCEQMIADVAASSSMKYVIFRYFNVAGAHSNQKLGPQNLASKHLIKVCLDVAQEKKPYVPIYGTDYLTPDGTGVRDYIHVMDIAAAHLKAIEYLAAGGSSDIFNVGYGKGVSVQEVISTAAAVTGQKIPYQKLPRRVGDSPSSIANNTKIKKVLTWEPQFNQLSQIIRDAWQWELNRK